MEQIALSDQDRAIILDLTAELRRFNDNVENHKPDAASFDCEFARIILSLS
jgi:hypothetical protein